MCLYLHVPLTMCCHWRVQELGFNTPITSFKIWKPSLKDFVQIWTRLFWELIFQEDFEYVVFNMFKSGFTRSCTLEICTVLHTPLFPDVNVDNLPNASFGQPWTPPFSLSNPRTKSGTANLDRVCVVSPNVQCTHGEIIYISWLFHIGLYDLIHQVPFGKKISTHICNVV